MSNETKTLDLVAWMEIIRPMVDRLNVMDVSCSLHLCQLEKFENWFVTLSLSRDQRILKSFYFKNIESWEEVKLEIIEMIKKKL